MLEDYNDVFSDIVNVLVFKGERRIDENSLISTNEKSMLKVDGRIHEQERDISKTWNDTEIILSEIGFENQTDTDNKMPFRVISYDGASYKKQLLSDNKEMHPVMTLVLYFGDKRWKYPKNLKGNMVIPEGMEHVVNDYPINLFEIAYLPDEVIDKFTSDFGIVARFFKNRRENKEYLNDKTTIKHVDEMLKFLHAVTGDNRYEIDVDEIPKQKGKVVNMCSVAEAIEKRGIEKGMEKGIEKGMEKGMEIGKVQVLLTLNKSIPEIVDITGYSEEKVQEIIKALEK